MIGEVTFFAGSGTPARHLPGDGSAVSRTTYSALFAIIGTTYGSGDGTTTFNLPTVTPYQSIPAFIRYEDDEPSEVAAAINGLSSDLVLALTEA